MNRRNREEYFRYITINIFYHEKFSYLWQNSIITILYTNILSSNRAPFAMYQTNSGSFFFPGMNQNYGGYGNQQGAGGGMMFPQQQQQQPPQQQQQQPPQGFPPMRQAEYQQRMRPPYMQVNYTMPFFQVKFFKIVVLVC